MAGHEGVEDSCKFDVLRPVIVASYTDEDSILQRISNIHTVPEVTTHLHEVLNDQSQIHEHCIQSAIHSDHNNPYLSYPAQ